MFLDSRDIKRAARTLRSYFSLYTQEDRFSRDSEIAVIEKLSSKKSGRESITHSQPITSALKELEFSS